jgi:hypothetical protein
MNVYANNNNNGNTSNNKRKISRAQFEEEDDDDGTMDIDEDLVSAFRECGLDANGHGFSDSDSDSDVVDTDDEDNVSTCAYCSMSDVGDNESLCEDYTEL